MKKIRYCKITILILAGWAILSVIGFLGKDTIYSRLLEDSQLGLARIVLYTTRPMREGEQEGREYHFTDEACFEKLQEQEKVIESRTYQTVYGPWTYFTADDGTLELAENSYLGIGTLESYEGMKKY